MQNLCALDVSVELELVITCWFENSKTFPTVTTKGKGEMCLLYK